MKEKYNICAIIQSGRLAFEAVLFILSFRHHNPDFDGRIILLEPNHTNNWHHDPRVHNQELRDFLMNNGAEIINFNNSEWGDSYPNSNKICGLSAMPKSEPFVFFDTDTLFTGSLSDVPFDFNCPSASLRCSATWPKPTLYGPGYFELWKSLYDKFSLEFESTLDLNWPKEHWKRYMYFNAGYFFYKCPHEFGDLYKTYAWGIDTDPPKEIQTQTLRPWLDQVALPLVIHKLGGTRNCHDIADMLDNKITCHYRYLPLLYATQPDETIHFLEELVSHNKIKKILKLYEPFKKLIYQKKGHKIRDIFDRSKPLPKEEIIRKKIKKHKLWLR